VDPWRCADAHQNPADEGDRPSRQIDSLRVITEQDAAACAIEVARRLFPAEAADVQTLFTEDPPPSAQRTWGAVARPRSTG